MFQFSTPLSVVTTTVTGQDSYGRDVLSTTETAVAGAVVWPATTGSEATQGQDIITGTLVCLLPPGAPTIAATDRVKVFGGTYEVEGPPYTWRSPLTGNSPGTQCNLRRVTG